jgi:hypothetical protein
VIAALKWLGVALSALRVLKPNAAGKLVKVKPYVSDLRALEEGSADTSAWSKIKQAHETRQVVPLTIEEFDYLHSFKGLWDKYFKRPIQRIGEMLDVVEEAED